LLIDTHTHLFADEFDPDRGPLIQKAIANGIQRFYMPNIDSVSIDAMLKLEKQFPANCFAMMGLHPCHVNASYEKELSIVKSWLDKRKFIGIGEIGIDLYWDKTFVAGQREAFKQQIQWALDFNYPVSIHCREAFDEIYQILYNFGRLPKAVFHCFSGTLEQADKIIALGNFKLGIGGVVTFKNSGLDKVIEQLDPGHLVLETDAPYLAPAPFRGKRNEPAHLLEIVRKIAQVKNLSGDEIARITTENADFIFGRQ
jgi:TatD DNase family protein